MLERIVLCAALVFAPTLADAQGTWPDRTITLIVPYAPGGATDIAGRLVADGVSKELGQPVIVENRVGGGGNIGVLAAASAAPDGYTFLMSTQTLLTQNPHLYPSLRKNAQRDMIAVGGAFATDMILVASPKLGIKSMRELIALAQSKPGRLNFGSAGNGSFAHVLMELLMSRTGLKMQHVPYRGTGPAMIDLVAGTLNLMIDSMPSAIGQIRAGTVVAIAVCGPKRNSQLPDVPTFAESGIPDYGATAWLAVVAPIGTPQPIVNRMNVAIKAVLARPNVLERAVKVGLDPDFLSPEDLARRVRVESDLWREVIAKAGITVN